MMQDDAPQPPSFESFMDLIEAGYDDGQGWEKEEDAGDGTIHDEDEGWLASCKFSPLELVIMMKADLATVQRAYEWYPQALTAELLRNACLCGAQPGVVSFLASKIPEAVSEADDLHDRLPIHLALAKAPGLNRPTEADILKL